MMGRKGSMLDMIFIAIAILMFGVMIVLSVYLSDAIVPTLTEAFGNESASVSIMSSVVDNYHMMDNMFLIVYVIFSIVPIFIAFLVKIHPVFLVINIIIMMVFFLILPMFSNMMREFWSSDEFSKYAEGGGGTYTFPIMTRVFMYLPMLSMAFSVILMVVMFGKGGDNTEG